MAGSSCTDCQVCDYNNQVTSFPLTLTVTPSIDLYSSVEEPIAIDFQWASRTTSPQFVSGSSTIDEAGTGNGGSGASNITTMRFNNITYNIFSVQISSGPVTTTPISGSTLTSSGSHNSWILPITMKSKNNEDLIITFYNPSASAPYNYVLVVIPIIRTGTASTDPLYLTALSSAQTRGTFSLASCMPAPTALFAYYSTCLDGYTQHKTPENANVFVAVQGISVSDNLMRRIAGKAGASVNFPAVSLPFITRFARRINSVDNTNFNQYVLTTRHLLNFANIKNIYKDLSINSREDPSSAYQCVPLDPDRDVVDGKLKIDLTSGKLLNDVLAERDAVRAAAAPSTPQTADNAARFRKFLSSAIGILCAILIFSILIFLISTLVTSKPAPVDPTAMSLSPPSWVQQIPVYGIMTVVAGLVGFVVGMMIV